MKYFISIILCVVIGNSQQAQNGKYADVNGVRLHYEIHGEGELLVFLHGLNES